MVRALKEREAQSSTAVNRWLAVRHVIVDGEEKFDILLARCRKGVFFDENAPAVKAVFILVGTLDERNFHLFSLAAIAQITGTPNFRTLWQEARGTQGLKDAVLLGDRMREGEG